MKHVLKTTSKLPRVTVGNREMFVVELPDAPAIDPAVAWRSSSERSIREAIATGRANGGRNVWYCNRDNGHAVVYKNAEQRNILELPGSDHPNYGRLVANGLLLENASIAINQTSVSRFQTGSPWTQAPTEALYRSGILMFNPEHRDYDLFDNFEVLSPYIFTSVGSSGSEKAHVQRCYEIASLIEPNYWQWLLDNQRASGAVMSLFLASLDGGYLDPDTHRPAIDRTRIAGRVDEQLIEYVTGLQAMPWVSIDTEDPVNLGKPSQAIYLTEDARQDGRKLRVTATADGSLPLEWHIMPLRGDVQVTIVESSDTGAVIDIEFTNRGAFLTRRSDGLTQLSRRSDVLIAASSGGYFSPPCYVSYHVPFGQERNVDYQSVEFAGEHRFDGTRGIETSFVGNVQAVSMAAWVKPDGDQPGDANVICAYQSGNSLSLRLESDGIECVAGRKGSRVKLPKFTGYTHVAATVDANEAIFYVGGVEVHRAEGFKFEDKEWELSIAKSRYGVPLRGAIRGALWHFGPAWSAHLIASMAVDDREPAPEPKPEPHPDPEPDRRDAVIAELRGAISQIAQIVHSVS